MWRVLRHCCPPCLIGLRAMGLCTSICGMEAPAAPSHDDRPRQISQSSRDQDFNCTSSRGPEQGNSRINPSPDTATRGANTHRKPKSQNGPKSASSYTLSLTFSLYFLGTTQPAPDASVP